LALFAVLARDLIVVPLVCGLATASTAGQRGGVAAFLAVVTWLVVVCSIAKDWEGLAVPLLIGAAVLMVPVILAGRVVLQALRPRRSVANLLAAWSVGVVLSHVFHVVGAAGYGAVARSSGIPYWLGLVGEDAGYVGPYAMSGLITALVFGPAGVLATPFAALAVFLGVVGIPPISFAEPLRHAAIAVGGAGGFAVLGAFLRRRILQDGVGESVRP
jgi:hypothetical protein